MRPDPKHRVLFMFLVFFFKIRPQLLLFATLIRNGQGRDLGLGDGFLIIAPKAQYQKKKLDKLDFIKI